MMWETCAEEGAIDVHHSELGNINFLTPRAVKFKSGYLQAVTESDGQNFLTIAKSAWASAIQAREKFVVNFSSAASRVNVPRVNKAIHVTCLLVELQELFIS